MLEVSAFLIPLPTSRSKRVSIPALDLDIEDCDKEAVEDIFQVHVLSVNTVMHHASKKSTGRRRLKVVTAKTKKVMVKLKAGEKIALFDVTGGKKA